MPESSSSGPDVEDEDLLEGQRVFNGPRKIRENLLRGDGSDNE